MGDETSKDAATEDVAPVVVRKMVVAVVDALGVKGIWKQGVTPVDVIASMRQSKESAVSSAAFHGIFYRPIQVATFSDTIIATCDPANGTLAESIAGVAFVMNGLGATAASNSVPMAYRGCIAVGDLAVSDDYFVGEAIDEAAIWHEQADAAVVWLTPRAQKDSGLKHGDQTALLEWEVPLKDGAVTVLAVNPLWTDPVVSPVMAREDPTRAIDELVASLLRPLHRSSAIDVVRKRQNTERFLAAARAYTLERAPAEADAFDAANEEGNRRADEEELKGLEAWEASQHDEEEESDA
jgi:hypothetical protein